MPTQSEELDIDILLKTGMSVWDIATQPGEVSKRLRKLGRAEKRFGLLTVPGVVGDSVFDDMAKMALSTQFMFGSTGVVLEKFPIEGYDNIALVSVIDLELACRSFRYGELILWP